MRSSRCARCSGGSTLRQSRRAACYVASIDTATSALRCRIARWPTWSRHERPPPELTATLQRIRCARVLRPRPRTPGRLEAAVMRHGRWKSVQVARRYIRAGTRWDDNPMVDIGL